MNRPLEDVTVLDLTAFLSGPFCTMTLAGLGAKVIKVEQPGTGDPVRAFPPYYGSHGMNFAQPGEDDLSLSILKRSRGKKSITLNLKSDRGRELFHALAAKVDVVVENFAPGVVERLGIDYPRVRRVNPTVIYCSVSGFGQNGPYRELPAFDPVVQAMGGAMQVTGSAEAPPLRLGIALGDQAASLYATIGILAALNQRKADGLGQYVDISMMDCLFALLFDEALDVNVDNGIPMRTYNRRLRLTPCNAYQTVDGYISIVAPTDDQFASLLRAMGREDLIGDPRYARLESRNANVDEVDALVEGWTKTLSKVEVSETLRTHRVPCGQVATIPELIHDAQLAQREMVIPLIHPLLGAVKGAVAAGVPIKMSAAKLEYNAPAPMLGQHNSEVYGGLLGMSGGEIAELQREGVI